MDTARRIGLISPGAMGASVGAAAVTGGARVFWAGADRGSASHERAARAGLVDCGSMASLVARVDLLLSICPPHDAESIAEQVAATGYSGLFADCNAISPERTRRLATLFPGRFVDGGIIGGPAWQRDAGTCLYLSGPPADTVSVMSLFSHEDCPLLTRVVADDIGAASALKMVFAAWTKGSTALLAAILAVADEAGVRDALASQWGEAFTARTQAQVTSTAGRAWRFAGEMREIAATFAAAGLPPGFHEAAADVYERLAGFKDDPDVELHQLLALLRRPGD